MRRADWSHRINITAWFIRKAYNCTQHLRWEWGSAVLCSPKGALGCHSEWMPWRCSTSGPWPYSVPIAGTLLVARMTSQMRQSIKTCIHCLQHEGGLSKAPLHPIVATTPLDLLHVYFTSIETTLELNKSPKVTNTLVFQDHFTKHVLAYVTPDQTAKTVTKIPVSGLHLDLWSPSQALEWQGCWLHEQCNQWDVQDPQHEEVADHALPPTD